VVQDSENTLNQLLTEMDGFSSTEGSTVSFTWTQIRLLGLLSHLHTMSVSFLYSMLGACAGVDEPSGYAGPRGRAPRPIRPQDLGRAPRREGARGALPGKRRGRTCKLKPFIKSFENHVNFLNEEERPLPRLNQRHSLEDMEGQNTRRFSLFVAERGDTCLCSVA
jgi:hypothetical protein